MIQMRIIARFNYQYNPILVNRRKTILFKIFFLFVSSTMTEDTAIESYAVGGASHVTVPSE